MIYKLLNGMLGFKDIPPEEYKYVEDEFEEGKVCEQAYAEILNAYCRLCQRLGVNGDEDNDVEIIIDRFETITEYLCMKMLDYGALFAQPLELAK